MEWTATTHHRFVPRDKDAPLKVLILVRHYGNSMAYRPLSVYHY